MSAQQIHESGNPAQGHREEMMSALFAHLVVQQSQMAMMLMGKVAHPDTGKTERNMEAAKLFIDMLEMLEEKTKSNLSKEEAALLKQTLMTLHLTFVEEVESSPSPPSQSPSSSQSKEKTSSQEPAAPGTKETELSSGTTSTPEEDHPKKFSKKY